VGPKTGMYGCRETRPTGTGSSEPSSPCAIPTDLIAIRSLFFMGSGINFVMLAEDV